MISPRCIGFCFGGFFVVTLMSACGGKPASPARTAGGYRLLDKAAEAFNQKDYAGAIPLLTTAIERGSLRADLLGETYVKRALCYIKTGDDAKAVADLDLADQAGGGGPMYLACRGFLAQHQGNLEKAKQLFDEARTGDPNLELPNLESPKKKKGE